MKTNLLNITVLMDSTNKRHIQLLTDMRRVLQMDKAVIIDFSQDRPLHMVYADIAKSKPYIIINLDFVGFILKTELENITLNGISALVLNITTNDWLNYEEFLKYRQNLSMYTYLYESKESEHLSLEKLYSVYSMIPNIYYFCDYRWDINSPDEDNTSILRSWLEQVERDTKHEMAYI